MWVAVASRSRAPVAGSVTRSLACRVRVQPTVDVLVVPVYHEFLH